MKVGFIGLGSMGGPIARRIARGGYDLVACDNDPDMLAAFDEPGVAKERDAIATARQVDVLGTCVRTGEQLEDLAGDGRLFEALGKGGTFIVHSTVEAALVRRLAEVAKAHGVDFLDIGVSGGTAVALDGGLLLLMGGDGASSTASGRSSRPMASSSPISGRSAAAWKPRSSTTSSPLPITAWRCRCSISARS